MARQTIPWHQWVVVDDCVPATRTTLGQERVEPRPVWESGQITLGRNLLAGLERTTGDAIAVIEDDDWYSPDYLENMSKNLAEAPLVGEGFVRYYNVRTRHYLEQTNARHACLSASMWRQSLTPRIAGVVGKNLSSPWYDLSIWRAIDSFILVLTRRFMVGIKGMPGRRGIGIGHHPGGCRNPDPNLEKLREWVGEDADCYAAYGC